MATMRRTYYYTNMAGGILRVHVCKVSQESDRSNHDGPFITLTFKSILYLLVNHLHQKYIYSYQEHHGIT